MLRAPDRSSMFKNIAPAAILCGISLAAGAAALILAECGASVWFFVLLFAWLLTIGLPTTSAVVLVAALWRGPSFLLFLIASAVLAFVFQLAAVWAVRSRSWAVQK